MTPEKLATQWISEMQQMEMTPDDMLRVIQMARKKYKQMTTDPDEDDSHECCDDCGCYHGHHPWCNASDEDDL